jgi:TonB family protein
MLLFAARLGFVAVLVTASAAHAQPAPAASSPPPPERAQHDADKVFRMILQHADKPRRIPRDEAAPATAAPRAPASPAAKAAAPAAATRPAEPPRITATTPPAVPPASKAAVAAPAGAAPSPAPATAADTSAASVAPEAAPIAIPGAPPTTAAVPAAAIAPVAVATPRSLKLELVSSVEPEFPARLVRSLGRGSVVVNFDVRPDGTVARTEVASSSHRGLNDAALAAVAAWRFKPISETLPGVVELKFE